MSTIKIGERYRFNYPAEFTTLPAYSAIRGQTVTVVRPCTPEEAEPPSEDMEGMFKVRTDDGREWDAWEGELEALP